MAASTADLNSTTLTLDALLLPVAASTNIYANENVAFDTGGNVVPMSNTAALVFIGYAELQALNTGVAGALTVPVNLIGSGPDGRLYIFDCAGATQAWCGTLGYFTDDHTVAQSASQSRVAGMVTQFLSSTKVVIDTSRRAL